MTLVKRSISKALHLDNNFSHVDRLPVSPRVSTVNQIGLSSTSSGQLTLLNTYGTVGWLFAVVDRISQSVACAEWGLFRRLANGDKQEIVSHPLLDLWNNVNPYQPGESFREAGQQHLELVGEWWIVLLGPDGGAPVELQMVRPDRMTVIPNPTEFIAGYIYRIGGERIPLEPNQVILIKRPNPVDPYRGLGPVQSLLSDIESERSASQYTRNLLMNGAEPGGIIETEDTLSDDDFERLVARWKETHQGVSNAGRVAFLERGHWVNVTRSQRDMQFEQLRKLNRDIITGAYGMPAAMLGVSENINRSNADAAELMFARWLIKPRLDRIKSSLNTQLVPFYDSTGTLMFDYVNPVPNDRLADKDEAIQGYEAGILTLNESRIRLGEGEVEEGGDEFKPTPSGGGLLGFEGGRQWKGWTKDPLLDDGVEKVETRVRRNWERRLKQEANALAEHITQFFIRRVKIELADIEGFDWDWWAKYGEETVAELEQLFTMSIFIDAPDLAPGQVQRLAAEYAQIRGAQLLRVDGNLNLVKLTRARVGQLVATAIEEGQGLSTLQRNLREDFAFSPERAQMVARTETATALGQGQKQVAITQDRDEKHWVTQGDAHVDIDICRANELQGWIKLVDPFQSGHDTVPSHPNCRCVVRYRTSEPSGIDPAEGLAEDAAGAIGGARMVTEVHCPKCDQRMAVKDFRGSSTFRCTRCKPPSTFTFSTIEEGLSVVRKIVERDDQGRIMAVTEEHPTNGRVYG